MSVTNSEINDFIWKMEADVKRMHLEEDALIQLEKAIHQYERVFGVKIRIPLAEETNP